jgi:hypothetical protein
MSYLQLVNGRYRVRIVVPPALRPIIGKESLVWLTSAFAPVMSSPPNGRH